MLGSAGLESAFIVMQMRVLNPVLISIVNLDWVFQVLAAAKELHRQANLSAGLSPAAVGLPDEAEACAFASQVSCCYWCWLSTFRNEWLLSLDPPAAGS